MSASARRIAAAARVISAELGRSGTPRGIAEALEYAGLLMSPETAAELADADGSEVQPNGCGACGLPQQGHAQRFAPGTGWHPWVQPSPELIKGRMLARQSAAKLRGLLAPHSPAARPTSGGRRG